MNPEEAENHYKEVLRMNPEDAETHNDYAVLLRSVKRVEEAEDHYKEALRINPELVQAHNNYANLLSSMKRVEEAEDHYKEALRINPRYANAHNNYANLLSSMKRVEEAEDHYKEALRINPNFARAHNDYAILLRSVKRTKEAEDHYKEALKPRRPQGVSKLASIWFISALVIVIYDLLVVGTYLDLMYYEIRLVIFLLDLLFGLVWILTCIGLRMDTAWSYSLAPYMVLVLVVRIFVRIAMSEFNPFVLLDLVSIFSYVGLFESLEEAQALRDTWNSLGRDQEHIHVLGHELDDQ